MTKHARKTSEALADSSLLDKIDKLFACNVGEYIDLPQLVVIGDQSSGKSSVLEGLTLFTFPRDSGLCTRHATQIIFRRTNDGERRITASIILGLNEPEERAAQLREWIAEDIHDLTPNSLSELMADISGPDEDHLSVIDVPGIFRNMTPGLTTKEDKEMVREMVESYMKNPRSIMLTVVPANVDIATQEIIEMAREQDPHGERTIGVITKPDLVEKGAESKVIDILEGKGQIPECLRGRHPEAASMVYSGIGQTRHSNIAGSSAGDCDDKCTQRISIGSLAFPAVSCIQRSYLVDVMSSFQTIVSHALNSNYGADDAFEDDAILRLATRVVNRNDIFSNDVAQWGHQHHFGLGASEDDQTSSDGDLLTRKVDTVGDLEGIVDEPISVSFPLRGGIHSWIEELYRASRGFEIGTFNGTLLSTMMKSQSTKWVALAKGYISDIIIMVHEFIVHALNRACPDAPLCHTVQLFLMDRLLETYQKGIAKVDFLLFVERYCRFRPLLSDLILLSRQRRAASAIEGKAFDDCSHGRVVRVEDLHYQRHLSNFEHTIQALHDILQSYYKVARKRFVDNICMQAAGYHLISGPDIPMKLFSPSLVSELSVEQLKEIAGEEPRQQRIRQQLEKEIRGL
ncbi:hypothetical protein M747DRAFT_264994 [Aspergillus niger ATCC 13496]|uniref:Contig An04c0250, genomic contig n=3 Tax=Aspergillus niger TaxID=5061 RepID=A2QJR3_ASPNC|nr:uncharacterized protein An04g07970 [Aspergillus niger]RDH17172.1 hypothetical protein M747DRAFT_264994 [Aspergillus niger ATCC 13496]CAK47954.1 unnamed protein product [Aspergillus niger]